MMRRINELLSRHPELEPCRVDLCATVDVLVSAFRGNRKLLVAGNGGSAADAEHIVGELMKNFCLSRGLSNDFVQRLRRLGGPLVKRLLENLNGALPAIALTGHPALATAFANDAEGDCIFAQQVYGYGQEGDVFLAISTSGNSKNVLLAAYTAKAKGMSVVGLAGRDGGELKRLADHCIVVPEVETFKIQELHLPIYHAICLELEEVFFS